ncbi:MAG: tRNA epoxyqueuosine(34) reductase QueG [Planctomycetes bacterium]|nr:tRNA epoxyqueuosine(34) reductase QueG [Planctomycetota bacterium]
MQAAGFHLAASFPLAALQEPHLQGWMDAGYAGELEWMQRHARTRSNPVAAFPRTKTVTVGLFEFGAPEALPPNEARIAHYAQGTDYHLVIKDMLRVAAAQLVAQVPGVWTRTFVDADPLNEKRCAELAGLGFIGKHTNLIVPDRGSWCFLGLLLTSLVVEDSPPPQPERCGSCTACLDICPTKAFPQPFVLDARRCISYLSIELRGVIPRELRALMGSWIFGCDLCLDVCPWNRFARQTEAGPFAPRPVLRQDLPQWLRLTAEEFDVVFRDSAMLRTGWRAFMRNVLVACGNQDDATLYEMVLPWSKHPDALLRLHAHWALGRLAPAEARLWQQECANAETDAAVLEELQLTLKETA